MSDLTPAPVPAPITPSRPMKVVRSLWIGSFVAGLLAIVFAFLAREVQLERLRELITELEPGQDPETLDAVATLVFWGSLGPLALVVIIEAILVRAMMRRHGGARWGLLVTLLFHGAVAVLADAFVVTPEWEGILVRVLLLAQLLLAGAGLIGSAFPAANAWLRAEHESSGRSLG